jgi:hypothetical protein
MGNRRKIGKQLGDGGHLKRRGRPKVNKTPAVSLDEMNNGNRRK